MTTQEAKTVAIDTLALYLSSTRANRSENFVHSIVVHGLQSIIRESNELHTIHSCSKLAISIIKLT